MLDRREFIWTFVSATSGATVAITTWPSRGNAQGVRTPLGRVGEGGPAGQRIGCLYNGYILTVDPTKALEPGSAADRHTLYVLHAVLIDSTDGRVVATYPSLEGDPAVSGVRAQPVADHPQLLTSEHPDPPAISEAQLISFWRNEGVAEELLTDLWFVDLSGAVATPGLLDDHFHATSWSKKLPAEGERFGFWADVGDPAYYTDAATWERVCTRQALWQMVADANRHIAAQGRDRIYLHGFWNAAVDDPDEGGEAVGAHLFASGSGCAENTPNPAYLLNRIGRGPGAPLDPPPDPCTSDPADWPPLDYELAPAILVHTSGQGAWYNSALLGGYNRNQEEVLAVAFEPVAVEAIAAPAAEDDDWTLSLDVTSPAAAGLLARTPPYSIDVVAEQGAAQPTMYLPFKITAADPVSGTLVGVPFLADTARAVLEANPDSLTAVPLYRRIVECIPAADWIAAAAAAGASAGNETTGYGHWDPANPHGSNWYNGAEIGLVEYAFDSRDQVWRPSGYAEHYVMRDALSAIVLPIPTVSEGMEHRRRLAAWCHRHGLTGYCDIMFYRRSGNQYEFSAYHGLSYDHRFHGASGWSYYDDSGVERSVQTGHYGLRTGIYYYLENAAEVDRILELARRSDSESDATRLAPPAAHFESPGWARWLGWKIQLDGGTGARTLFSNSPMAKPRADDPYETVDADGNRLTFLNHSFGLLTMTNVQEQVFTSRESAALYWLVRESDPSSIHHNPALVNDWSVLSSGVVNWLELDVDAAALRSDLANLQHVPLGAADSSAVRQLGDKIEKVIEQVQDGWQRTLTALAKIWYACSLDAGIPGQVVTHCVGDGAVDLLVRAIRQLRDDLAAFPGTWQQLPEHWQTVVPEDADLALIRRDFDNQRFRVEHLLNISGHMLRDITGENGLDADSTPATRNVVFSTQPALLALDGYLFNAYGFPYGQEMWEIPTEGFTDLWHGLPWRPRAHHHMPLPVFMEHDVAFTINTDPPAVRDPRPALTVIAAVARTPVEIDPTQWLDQEGNEPRHRPPDYLVGKVYSPLGLTTVTPDNPMQITVEQALSAMTFWAAHVTSTDHEQGAVAGPEQGSEAPGRFADMVVWRANPLAIKGPTGATLDTLGRVPEGANDPARIATINAFIDSFRPAMTIVGGVPVYVAD